MDHRHAESLSGQYLHVSDPVEAYVPHETKYDTDLTDRTKK
jgi:hypothetical protein